MVAAATQITYVGATDSQRVPLSISCDVDGLVAWMVPDRRDAVGPARDAVVSTVAERCWWAPVERVRMVVSELVTNALRYGAPPCVLYLQHSPTRLSVAVYDHGPGFLVLRRAAPRIRRSRIPSTSRASGRGLHLVNELSHGWQAAPLAGGTVVIVHWRAAASR